MVLESERTSEASDRFAEEEAVPRWLPPEHRMWAPRICTTYHAVKALARLPQSKGTPKAVTSQDVERWLLSIMAALPDESRSFHSVAEACDAFVAKVQHLTQVKLIYLVENGSDEEEGPTVWTIIDAPPFDRSAYEPVYRAHVELRRALVEPLVDFRVLNVRELCQPATLSELPSEVRLLWRR